MRVSDLLSYGLRDISLQALAAMHDSLLSVTNYIPGSREEFDADRKVQDAIMYRLLCAGEAAKRFCDAYEGAGRQDQDSRRAQVNSDITKVELTGDQWYGIMGIRDALAHKIDEQDLDIVWNAATEHVPAMITPIWSALKTAHIEWLSSAKTPGRIAAVKRANEELKEPLDELLASLRRVSLASAAKLISEMNDTVQKALNATLAEGPQELLDSVKPSEVALTALETMATHDERLVLIGQYLEENYDDEELQAISIPEGPHATTDEVIAEYLELDDDTGEWTASITATVAYGDAEDPSLWTKEFEGSAGGTISTDNEIDIEFFTWSATE